ncbi:S8 family serine peptidase [Paenibacillus sp. GCM10023250]|uniref:S8 family serine peptidase n=1 Tax=Paenibacillus sp. GCM10023250 TaxID=3252648 RepID=UPI00362087F8
MNWNWKRQTRKQLSVWLTALLAVTLALPASAGANAAAGSGAAAASSPRASAAIDPLVTERFGDSDYVTYIVRLKEQTNTSEVSRGAQAQAANKKLTPASAEVAVRNAVIGELRATSLRTQGSLEAFLKQAKSANAGVKDYTGFFIVNALSVTSTRSIMEQIALRPEVEAILPNRTHTLHGDGPSVEPVPQGEPAPGGAPAADAAEPASSAAAADAAADPVEWNLHAAGVPEAWNLGIDGTGIVVANLDSGVDYTHPALARKWRANVGGTIVHPELSWYDPTGGSPLPQDLDGHGTHTMGTMVGSEADGRNQVGAAPGAKWIAVRIFAPDATDEALLKAGQWLIAPVDSDGNLHPEMAPDVVNNSWGSDAPGQDELFRPVVQAWRDAGIFPAFAAGNKTSANPGGPGSIVPPGNYPESFATGATDQEGHIALFSLRGPSPYGEVKPDVAAPGVAIRSSTPSGRYDIWEGTSMASPLTAGIAALVMQADPSLSVEQVERLITETAVPKTDETYADTPNNGYGHGIVNAYNAVKAVIGEAGSGTVSGTVLTSGEDAKAPVIALRPLDAVYAGREAAVSADVTDDYQVENVDLYVKSSGMDDYTVIPMTQVSGSYNGGRYEAALPLAGLTPGTQLSYYAAAADHLGNRAESPVYAVAVSGGIKPGYAQDFESNPTGYATGGELDAWGIGLPKYGPRAAYSGNAAAAASLNKVYEYGSDSFLQPPPVDLTDSPEGAIVSFKNWYNLAQDEDYGTVYATAGDGVKHELARFTGDSYGWKTQFLDLRPYAGQQVTLTFQFTANGVFGGTSNGGWYLDDLSVQPPDSDAPSAPAGLTGTSDEAGNISLSWTPVGDEDVAGYNILRADGDGAFEPIGTSVAAAFSDLTARPGTTARYRVAAVDYSGNESAPSPEAAVEVPNVVPLFADSFDGTSDNGWTHYGDTDDWQRGTPVPPYGPKRPMSLPNAWGTNLTGNYPFQADYALVSPVIDLSEADNASVYFYNWYEIDYGADFGRLELSADDGATWTELAAFTGRSTGGEWELFGYDLSAYAHQHVQFRFRMESDFNYTYAGWFIDNFRVVTAPAPSAVMAANHVFAGTAHAAPKPAGTPDAEAAAAANGTAVTRSQAEAEQPQTLPVNATVTVLETGRSVKTDPLTGEYAFANRTGEYTLRAEAYGYYPQEKPVTIAKDADAAADFVMEAVPYGRLAGVVTDALTHEPVAGAVVMVLEDARIAPVRTDERGAFSLDVLEGAYTLSVSAGDYKRTQVAATVPPNGSAEANVALKPLVGYPNAIGYDDGSGEYANSFYNDGNGYAVRMTPSSGDARVTGAMFKFWDTSWPDPGATAFRYALYDAKGPGGSPGGVLAGPFQTDGLRNGEWTTVTFPSPVEVQEDFYVVYIQVGHNEHTIGMSVDETHPQAGRSWELTAGAWHAFPDGNIMIRALVNDSLGAPAIASPAANSFTNQAAAEVTGSTPAEGADVRVYNGDEPAGSGTVRDGAFAVPVELREGPNVLTAEFVVGGKPTDRSAPVTVTLDRTKPALTVDVPGGQTSADSEALTVKGTASDANFGALTVNGEAASVGAGGSFSHRLLLNPGDNAVTVTAKDLAGNETTITRHVNWNGSNGNGNGGTVIITPPPTLPGAAPLWHAVIAPGQTPHELKLDERTENGTAVARIADVDLKQALGGKAPAAVVAAVKPDGSQPARLLLTASQAAMIAQSGAANALVFASGTAAIALPAAALTGVPAGSEVQVTLSEGTLQQRAFEQAAPGLTVVGSPAAFDVSVVRGTTAQPLSLSGNVLVRQAFALPSGADAANAGVLYLTGGQASPAPAVFAPSGDGRTTVTIARPGYGVYAVAKRTIAFLDIDGSAAKAQIAALANRLLVDGTSADAFSPKLQVTRAQFAAMLTRALGLPIRAGAPFTDVPANKWYAGEVGAAYEAGLIQGIGNGRFQPDGLIARQDLALMLERAAALLRLKLDVAAEHASFSDAGRISAYAKNAVQLAADSAMMTGTQAAGLLQFRPQAPATREEAAAAIYRLLQLGGYFEA